MNTRTLYNAGNFESIEAVQNWYITNTPSRVWGAYIDNGGILILGSPYKNYMKGYGSYISFGYFSTEIKLTRLNDGEWIEI